MPIDINPDDDYEGGFEYDDDRQPPPGIFEGEVMWGKEYDAKPDKAMAWNLKFGVRVPSIQGARPYGATYWHYFSRDNRRQWGPMVKALFGRQIEQAKATGQTVRCALEDSFGRRVRLHFEWSTKNPDDVYCTKIEPVSGGTVGAQQPSMADAMDVPQDELPF